MGTDNVKVDKSRGRPASALLASLTYINVCGAAHAEDTPQVAEARRCTFLLIAPGRYQKKVAEIVSFRGAEALQIPAVLVLCAPSGYCRALGIRMRNDAQLLTSEDAIRDQPFHQ